ncbi:hypothetical protein B0A48_17598 [Cryoendolithus antarcticus]|uniref:Carboxypeptidase n=1 Tax=Cryoendolithus antarcticus TaxID=1507870 RepID=A0A1V8SB36_9PEZI|nr:hypothetical protein B0A48_17598 [Cryoendolithus antarcticus]
MFATQAVAVLAFAGSASASLSPIPKNVLTNHIPSIPGASISYKETFICGKNAKAVAGYVHMPSTYLKDVQDLDNPYNASYFFWFYEASCEVGVKSDGGPCNILGDSNTTESNPWSWNENSNMLYVDQPLTKGFSYSTFVNSTLDLLFDHADPTQSGILPFDAYNGSVPTENSTFLYGTLPIQDPTKTANNRVIAAHTLWHFAQLWFTDFPEYKTRNDRLSLAGNSYGGYWVSTSAAHFQRQNSRIEAGEFHGKCLHLDSAVITNGCIDLLYQTEWYPRMAYNYTYNVSFITEQEYTESLYNWTKPGGGRDLILECRALGAAYDPTEFAINSTVNEVCIEALGYRFAYVAGAYTATGRSAFDMAALNPNPLPPDYVAGWANRAWVQEALGVPVNFTSTSNLVTNQFVYGSGDFLRRAGLPDVEYLLDQGVKVTLIYGDRDYRCPWLDVEQLSLQANWSGAESFRKAGYEQIVVNDSYVGGVVRQYGGLSFSRVFQAGHDVSFYQPETSYQIFNRALANRDAEALANGTAVIENFIVTKPGPGGGPIGGTGFA